MFMSQDPLRWPEVVPVAPVPGDRRRAMMSEGWWRPMNGYLVAPPQQGTYAHQADRYLGYVLSLAMQRPQAVVLTGTVAARLLGHPVFPSLSNIDAYVRKGTRAIREFRPYPGTAEAVTMRPMNAPDGLPILDLGRGVLVTSREQAAVDVARLAATETAFITICSILGVLATTGAAYQDRTDPLFLEQEAAARARMMAIAERLPNSSGRRRAMQIIELASGQVESLAEARVLWLIHAYGLPTPIMQYQIKVDGREFFGDFVWPDRKLIVEFNGEGKYGDDEKKGQRVADERARESLLRSAGYEVVNLSWKQLRNPGQVAMLIYRFLCRRVPSNSQNDARNGPAAVPHPVARRDLFQPAKPIRGARTVNSGPGTRRT